MTPKGFNYRKYIVLPAAVIAAVLVAVIATLYFLNMAFAAGDLTNSLTVAVEVGIGVFISIIVFYHSKFQQQKAEDLLSDVKNINEKIEQQRKNMKEAYTLTIVQCLKNIWKKTTLIILNLDLYKMPENTEAVQIKELEDILQTYKTQLLLYLDQLQIFAVLGSTVLDSNMISSILDLKQQLHDNVIQKGTFRASQPWSSTILFVDTFVIKYLPDSINEFALGSLEKLLPAETLGRINRGRSYVDSALKKS